MYWGKGMGRKGLAEDPVDIRGGERSKKGGIPVGAAGRGKTSFNGEFLEEKIVRKSASLQGSDLRDFTSSSR